ncbi:MAG TPA: primosomal protein N', partial [Microbacterium sp.]|nr:primosomal protein N' [Microbacterium sp.]
MSERAAPRRVARVLIDSPLPQLDRLFDYAVPDEHRDAAVPGVRVKVPLRSAGRVVDAYIVEVGEEDAVDRPLSPLDEVVSPVPVLPARLHTLVRRVADRAAGSAGDILRLVIPKRMVRAEKAWLAGGAQDAAASDPVTHAARESARRVLDEFPTLRDRLAAGERVAVTAPPRTVAVSAGDGAESTVGGWAVLMAAAALECLAAGRSAVLVVPDHRDQAQLEAALAGRVAEDALVRDDARRSGPERYAAYLRVLSERPCVVIGNRSAVYAPAHDLGLIALWDDSDPLLAEPLSPGVHARDAALVRQELDGCALLFAGHTRSTDVERLVSIGWVTEVRAARPLRPRVVLSATTAGDVPARRVPSIAYAAARTALEQG